MLEVTPPDGLEPSTSGEISRKSPYFFILYVTSIFLLISRKLEKRESER